MSDWRPPQRIRIISIAIAWRAGQPFSFEVVEADGRLRRPSTKTRADRG